MRTTGLWVALAAVFAVSCIEATGPNLNSDTPGYLISSVDVVPNTDTVFLSDSAGSNQILLRAIATGKHGGEIPGLVYFWESSDPLVATVNGIGVVTLHNPGIVEISASADKIGTATLVVFPDPSPPAPPAPPAPPR